ncbi:glycosyltransferase family 4 protein [Cypionkella sp.]|uniref:glycosyltransferase family 4 protein n=1 Tax=Cypionkella sp. TaxID=2811411 RepID=UPI00271AF4B3|nr:glycosyltransferase family 4 protein [Cypionkella sp.]MDO8982544.1 glycosyltransferase family 4 protein [Cypionkella sp.]MDP2050547.1 glycosyltransferase family 4 protein [Cypionkella sp.]
MSPTRPHPELKKRLVVVVKGYPRLSETFIAQELRGLELAGLDLVIVSLRHPTDKKRHAVHDEIAANLLYLPEYLHREPLRVLRGLWAARRHAGFWPTLRGWLNDLSRDPSRNRIRRLGQAAVLVAEWPQNGAWLHAHFIHTPASVADYAARILHIGWTVSAHAKDIWTSPDWELSAKLSRAKWAVTCTEIGHKKLQSLTKTPETVHLSYHGLNLDRFPPFTETRPNKDGKNPADPVQIVSVGRAVPKKGYDTLLHALALLPADLHWRFTHLGGGPDREALQAFAETLGLTSRIHWQGSVDQAEVLAAYRASDLFALACRITPDGDRDGLPNVLVEAASQGLACLSTNISGIPELFRNAENGWLTPPDNPEALAAALQTAITQPDLRAQYGRAAAAQVRATLDYHHSVSQLAALFAAEGIQPWPNDP